MAPRASSSIPLPGEISIFGLTLIPGFRDAGKCTKLAFYYTACVLMVLTFAAMYRLVNSRLGHLCRSLQQNEELASSIGVNIAYLRIVVLCHFFFLRRHRRGDVRRHLAIGLSVQLSGRRFREFHAELLPWRPGLCLWPDAWHTGPLFRLGPCSSSSANTSCWSIPDLLIALMLVLPNGLLSLRFRRKEGDK